MTQEVCDKAFDKFIDDFLLDWYKTQEMCDSVLFEDPLIIAYCPYKYET